MAWEAVPTGKRGRQPACGDADPHVDALRLHRAQGHAEIARPAVRNDWEVEASEWNLFTKPLPPA